mmetsp:Transcript_16868/g.46608  ORF Transcript_16868/g.46608 Transcript_16868/m.46608 type:complete len:161 (-) Transcript_16868:760-1242(-)
MCCWGRAASHVGGTRRDWHPQRALGKGQCPNEAPPSLMWTAECEATCTTRDHEDGALHATSRQLAPHHESATISHRATTRVTLSCRMLSHRCSHVCGHKETKRSIFRTRPGACTNALPQRLRRIFQRDTLGSTACAALRPTVEIQRAFTWGILPLHQTDS